MKRLVVALMAVAVLGLAPTALAGGALSGKYQTVIKGSPLFHGFLNGKWAIRFVSSNDTYHVTKDGHAVTHGKNTFNGNVITFKDAPSQNACPTTGKYTFKLKGKTLTFKKISDSGSGNCIGREQVLKRTLTKV